MYRDYDCFKRRYVPAKTGAQKYKHVASEKDSRMGMEEHFIDTFMGKR